MCVCTMYLPIFRCSRRDVSTAVSSIAINYPPLLPGPIPHYSYCTSLLFLPFVRPYLSSLFIFLGRLFIVERAIAAFVRTHAESNAQQKQISVIFIVIIISISLCILYIWM